VLLAPIDQGAECPGGLESVRQVDLELAASGDRLGGRIGGQGRAELFLLLELERILGGHFRPVGVPHRQGRPGEDPRAFDAVEIHGQALRSGDIGHDYRAVHRFSAGAFGPGPAVCGDGPGEWSEEAHGGGTAFPGDAELIGLEPCWDAVCLETGCGPLVGPPHCGRAGETRTDDVAQVLEVLHDLGAIHCLVEEATNAGGIDGRLGGERSSGREE
jgi:hypothetical protein